MLLDINFLDVGNVSFQKLPMAKNGEKWRKMAKNGEKWRWRICLFHLSNSPFRHWPPPPPVTDQTVNGVFPNMSGTVWVWSDDGERPKGLLEFLADGKIKSQLGKRQGGWTIKDGGFKLALNFNGGDHILSSFSQDEVAILLKPIRYPPSSMVLLKGMSRTADHFIICFINVSKMRHKCMKSIIILC